MVDNLIKFGIVSIAFLIAGIPTWIWLLMYNFASPDSFWEKFALFGLGLWIFGAIQLVLLIFFIVTAVGIIFEN